MVTNLLPALDKVPHPSGLATLARCVAVDKSRLRNTRVLEPYLNTF
jgi:hypothetical protein